MNVLVLGATSVIGAHVAEAFAPGNNLLLAGRDSGRLSQAAARCRAAAASRVVETAYDLRQGMAGLGAASAWPPDVIVNAASSTSRLRDDVIPAGDLSAAVAVDLLAPLELIRSVVGCRGSRQTHVVFISSVLAAVPSPRRVIYGSLKRMHEEALLAFARSEPGVRVLIARLAKPISPDHPSRDAARFAAAVRRSFDEGKVRMSFGLSGRLMTALFLLQPAVFHLAVNALRIVRRRNQPDLPDLAGHFSTMRSETSRTFTQGEQENL
jgi:short-subunit dehydrogenase involved in D-alanine esterification of teichoic acids